MRTGAATVCHVADAVPPETPLLRRTADGQIRSDPQPPMTGPYRIINLAEAGLWIVAGLLVLILRRGELRSRLILAITLLAFGVSDIVETQTGAWWRPWWLLLWKAACVLSLLVFLIRQARSSRHISS